jgi:hypothetical protein
VLEQRRAHAPSRWQRALDAILASSRPFTDPNPPRDDDAPELVLAHEVNAAERAAAESN